MRRYSLMANSCARNNAAFAILLSHSGSCHLYNEMIACAAILLQIAYLTGNKQVNSEELVIQQTKKWISDVVIGCNFCPFAAKEIKQNSIHYQVETGIGLKVGLQAFHDECIRLDKNNDIETSFLIFTNAFNQFDDYLDLVSLAEKLLKQEGYEGIYQVASFHPLYCFANASDNDAANYTNRSVYQMLHLLREERIEQALQRYTDPQRIPERNIQFAREKGVAYMKMLRDACL